MASYSCVEPICLLGSDFLRGNMRDNDAFRRPGGEADPEEKVRGTGTWCESLEMMEIAPGESAQKMATFDEV